MKSATFLLLTLSLAGAGWGASLWPERLWLDRGGFWTNRVAVTVANGTTNALAGCGVAVPLPREALGDDLRLTDDRGELLAFTRRADSVILPATVPAQTNATYFAYWGNPTALRVPNNEWPETPDATTRVQISVGAIERRAPRITGETARWIDGAWRHRVPIRIAHFGPRNVTDRPFRVRLAEAVHETRNPVWRFTFEGREWPCERNGSDLVFRRSMTTNTIDVFYLYVKAGDATARMSFAESAGGELVPNDTRIDDTPRFNGVYVRFAHIGALEFPPRDEPALAVEPADLACLVFPDRPVTDRRGEFTVRLAKNERETLQLAVRTRAAHPDFTCTATPPRNAAGDILAVEPGWTECVFVDAPSAFYVHDAEPWKLKYPHNRHPTSDGWSGWWPDPIVPGERTSLAARETKAFRLLVKTTARTPAGEYRGELVWKSCGREIRRDPYRVTVWNFALPATHAFTATFDVRGLKTSAAHAPVYDKLAEYGLTPDQSCRTLAFARAPDGAVTCDFAEFDRLTERYFEKWKFADAYFPRTPFSFFGWSRTPRAFLGEEPYEKGETDRTNFRPAYRAAFQAAERLFWNHLKAKGWSTRFIHYISDEPYLDRPEIVDQQKAICDMIHEVDPAIPVYSSTWRWCGAWEACLDIWGVSASGRYPVEKIRELQARGKRFWFTTDAQFPLDTPYLASERLFPIIGFFLNVEKYECWNCINYSKENVWKYGFDAFTPRFGVPGKPNRWVRVPCGDGVLLYPPRDGSSREYVATVRLDAVRDGLETHDYLRLLRADATDEAHALLADYEKLVVIPNPGGRYSKLMLPEPAALGILRERAGAWLDRRATVSR